MPDLNPLIHPSIMMRKDVLSPVGGYSPDIDYAQDRDLWGKLCSTASFYNLNKVLIKLRLHKNNVSKKYKHLQQQTDLKVAKKIFESLLEREITDEIVISYLSKRNDEIKTCIKNAKLTVDLYNSFKSKHKLTIFETRVIKNEVAMNLYYFSVRWPFQLHSYMLKAVTLNPKLILRLAKAIQKRL